jgi:hypothetical protein
VQAEAEPGRVFALAHAVVARWWEQALAWEREETWPRQLHPVADGNAGPKFERWRAASRNTAISEETRPRPLHPVTDSNADSKPEQ